MTEEMLETREIDNRREPARRRDRGTPKPQNSVGVMPKRVEAFLSEHTRVKEILDESSEMICAHFGTTAAEYSIEEDPEEEYDEPCLLVEVLVDMSVNQASEALDAFGAEWAPTYFVAAQGMIAITAKPKPCSMNSPGGKASEWGESPQQKSGLEVADVMCDARQ